MNYPNWLPGKTILADVRGSAFPPLWLWMRTTTIASLGMLLFFLGYESIGQTVIVISVIQTVAFTMTKIFQAAAKGIQRRYFPALYEKNFPSRNSKKKPK